MSIKRRVTTMGEKTCLACGITFPTKLGGKRERQVCSKECANSYFHTYKNPNFKRVDNNRPYQAICWQYHVKRCVVCNEERIVEAHHGNGDHKDNCPENFVPLCPTHHQYWHSRYRHLVQDAVEQYMVTYKNIQEKQDNGY